MNGCSQVYLGYEKSADYGNGIHVGAVEVYNPPPPRERVSRNLTPYYVYLDQSSV
jgi:hypothetical protein